MSTRSMVAPPNRRTKSAKMRRARNGGNVAQRRDEPRVVISRSPFLMPERYSARLTYASTFHVNNAGFKDAAYVLRPSSIYDVDPALGGASAFGLAEFSQFYARYKVYSSNISLHVSNMEVEPVTVFVTPSLDNPGNNPSDLGPWFAATSSKMLSLGPYTGNPAATLRHSFATQKLTGVDFYAEDAYAAPVNNNPASNVYWVIGAVKAGPGNFTSNLGVAVVVKAVITVHFYGRKPLVSPAAQLHRASGANIEYPPPVPVYMVPAPTSVVPPPLKQ